jgi:hypothetical protein
MSNAGFVNVGKDMPWRFADFPRSIPAAKIGGSQYFSRTSLLFVSTAGRGAASWEAALALSREYWESNCRGCAAQTFQGAALKYSKRLFKPVRN